VLSKEVLLAWSEEAGRADDPILAALLLQLSALRNCSDHWSIEMLKRIADIRVSEAAAGSRATTTAAAAEDWPDVLDG
jgi:hypothetical protein